MTLEILVISNDKVLKKKKKNVFHVLDDYNKLSTIRVFFSLLYCTFKNDHV